MLVFASVMSAKRTWSVRLPEALSIEDGLQAAACLAPGRYQMREIDPTRYALERATEEQARLWYSQVRRLIDAGRLIVDGRWP